jgi:hypothetical protein
VIDTGVDDVTRRWTLRLVAGLAAGAVLLSGCSGQQEANDTLPGADATPSASEAELPPLGPPDLPMPAEARTQDAAGAEAFVRYYIDLINRTSTVMDAAPLREFSSNCEECSRLARDVDEDLATGYSYDGGQLIITEIPAPLIRQSTAEMALVVDQEPLTVVDASGALVADLSSDAYLGLSGGVTLAWDESQQTWLMENLTLG